MQKSPHAVSHQLLGAQIQQDQPKYSTKAGALFPWTISTITAPMQSASPVWHHYLKWQKASKRDENIPGAFINRETMLEDGKTGLVLSRLRYCKPFKREW